MKIVFEPQPNPRKIQALAGKTIVKMACGNNHSGAGQSHSWPISVVDLRVSAGCFLLQPFLPLCYRMMSQQPCFSMLCGVCSCTCRSCPWDGSL